MSHKSLEELSAIIGEVQPIDSGFSFRGKDYRINPAIQADTERYPALFNLLTPVLYSECYAKKYHFQKYPDDENGLKGLAEGVGDAAAYLDNLIAHNHTTGITDSGWLVTALLDGGFVQVSKYGVTRSLRPGEYIPKVYGMLPQVNEVISFKTKNGDPQPGFYYVYSDEIFDYDPTIIRFYWNVSAKGAAEVVSGVTKHLNANKIPFLFKCLIDPTHFTRRDCCVLYLQSRYLEQVLGLLPLINETAKPYMFDDVSLLGYKLMPGLGLAESPIDGNSFGMHRMQLVASALLHAFHQNKTKTEDRMELVANIFATCDIDINVPFLNEKSQTRTLDVVKKMNF